MKTEIRKDLPYGKTLVLLTVFAVVFGALASLTGEIFVPFAAALYAAILLFENRGKRIISYALPVVFIAFNIIFGGYIPVIAIEAALIGFAIFFMFRKGMSKGECAGVVTAIASVMLVLSLIAGAMHLTGEYSFEAVRGFYTELYESMKLDFTERLKSLSVPLSDGVAESLFNAADIDAMFSSIVNSLLSMLVIVGFAIAGVTFKVFGAVASRISEDPRLVVSWRFSTSNVFAYFYIALFILTAFIGSGVDVFSVTVINLYNIFMIVYAYIGFNYVHAMLSVRRSPAFTFVILVIALLLMSNLAISLLSAFGVFFTVMRNKSGSVGNS